MNDVMKWIGQYGDLSIVMKIAVPVTILLLVGVYAFFLWAAGRITSKEEVNYLRAFSVCAIEFPILMGLAYLLFKTFGGDSIESLGEWQTLVSANVGLWLVDLGILIGLLIALVKLSPVKAILTGAVRLVLLVHLGAFVTGTVFAGRALFIGVQSPGAFQSDAFNDNMTTGVLLLIASLSGLVLWMAGALASAEKLTFLHSIGMSWVKNGILVAIYYLGRAPLESALPTMEPMQRMLIMGGILLAVNLVLDVVGSMLLAGTSFARGILLWILEIPLWVLLGALVVGIDMVAMSIIQTSKTPSGAQVLEYVSIGLLGAVVAALVIYFGGQLLTPAVGAPRRSAA